MRVRAPTVVRPVTTTWLARLTPSPSDHVRAHDAERADDDTVSRASRRPRRSRSDEFSSQPFLLAECTCFGGVGQHGADLGFGDGVAVDLRLAEEPPDAAAVADLAHMIVQLVAGKYGLAELGLVDPHEIDELGLVVLAEAVDAQRACGLRQALDDQHARHHRILREVALEERLVDGHVLDADARLVAVDVVDAIEQQEGVAVRQQLQNLADVRRRRWRLSSGRSSPSHSICARPKWSRARAVLQLCFSP